MAVSSILLEIDKKKELARTELIQEIGDLSLESITSYLENASKIEHPGRGGTDVRVNKYALHEACKYIRWLWHHYNTAEY